MLRVAILFLIVALIAGLLGMTRVAGAASDFAYIAFFIFLVLFAVSLVFGLAKGAPPPV